MSGGVSHVDTFDPKPMLDKFHGEPLEGKGRVRVRQGYPGPLDAQPVRVQEARQERHRCLEPVPTHGDRRSMIWPSSARPRDGRMTTYSLIMNGIQALC